MRSSSEQSVNGPRKQSNAHFAKMIAAYATAAGAVGVALLAETQLANAEVVYTKARVTIGDSAGQYLLDVNHDGIPDFLIGFCSCRPHGTAFTIEGTYPRRNSVLVLANGSAAPLPNGAPIGPKQAFKSASFVPGVGMAFYGSYGTPYSGGAWMGVIDHYVGLKFTIEGQIHYGWARMTITKHIGHAILTGYAYETIPNKPLKAGQTTETPDANETESPISWAVPAQGPSLGMLARGAEALEVWRKKEQGA